MGLKQFVKQFMKQFVKKVVDASMGCVVAAAWGGVNYKASSLSVPQVRLTSHGAPFSQPFATTNCKRAELVAMNSLLVMHF